MRHAVASILAVFLLSACAIVAPVAPEPLADMSAGDGVTRPVARPVGVAPPPDARTAEAFDTTTEEERNTAAAGAAGGKVALGVTIASLGAPSEPGFWLKTPLVTSPAKGQVIYPATGKSVAVDLIPIDGPSTAGSRMSLAAMRLVGAPLAGLPEIEVYRLEE